MPVGIWAHMVQEVHHPLGGVPLVPAATPRRGRLCGRAPGDRDVIAAGPSGPDGRGHSTPNALNTASTGSE